MQTIGESDLSHVNSFSEFIEDVVCPICEDKSYNVIRESQYPENPTKEYFVDVYSSSSDEELVDQLVSCKKCELVYLNPRVKSEIVLGAYSSGSDPAFINQNEYRIQTFKQQFLRITKDNSIKPSRDIKVLDVGCAGGAFPKAAFDLGFSVTGVEPSLWLCDQAKKLYRLDIRPGILQDQEFEDNSFDIITLWDVIEHLTAPEEVLCEIKRILKDDGLLVINYPDYASFARKFFRSKWPFFLNVHLFYFTPKTISQLLSKCGFEVLSVRSYWQSLSMKYVFNRASQQFSIFKPVEKLSELLGVGKKPVKYNMGQSLVIAKLK